MNSYKHILSITGLGELLPWSVFSSLGSVTVYCFGDGNAILFITVERSVVRGLQVRTPHHNWLEEQHDRHLWVQRLVPPWAKLFVDKAVGVIPSLVASTITARIIGNTFQMSGKNVFEGILR